MAHFQRDRPISRKEVLGVLIKDSPRYLQALYLPQIAQTSSSDWPSLCNRQETLLQNGDGPGVRCVWQYTSRLHACEIIPSWNQRLMTQAFGDWPIQFADSLCVKETPVISFVFAHKGQERVPQLVQVLKSLFAQEIIPIECIVVDLSHQPVQTRLPKDVNYIHVPTEHISPGWRKSWAYNIGARHASGEVLVFHDGDICAPYSYALELHRWLVESNYQAASIQRFLFYLSQTDTQTLFHRQTVRATVADSVLQNWLGGTIAVRRDAFFEIGGFDEGFVDWGGEDNEFFSRCSTLKHLTFGYLPFIHLWHRPQRDRKAQTNLNISHVLPERLTIEATKRCAELQQRQFGSMALPDPYISYAQTIQQNLNSSDVLTVS